MSHNFNDYYAYNLSTSSDNSSEHSVALIKDQQTEKSSEKDLDSIVSIYAIDPINENKNTSTNNRLTRILTNPIKIVNKKPFIIDLWDKTKHLCSLCLCFMILLFIIYLLFKLFSGQ
jgi:hypothetical protein